MTLTGARHATPPWPGAPIAASICSRRTSCAVAPATGINIHAPARAIGRRRSSRGTYTTPAVSAAAADTAGTCL